MTPRARQIIRRQPAVALTAVAVLIVSMLVGLAPDTRAAPARASTVVSLTFDDSNADQLAAAAIMRPLGLTGTFYAIAGSIGTPDYLTVEELRSIAADGNEIGGHTVNHADLATVDADEATRQICQARSTLMDWGFDQRSFAYPYASVTPTAAAAAQSCGYHSARGLGDVRTRFGCNGCRYAETIPPADPFTLAAPAQVDVTWTLADLKRAVTNAESHRGGWVILTFHHIGGSDGLSVSTAVFSAFSSWLASRTRTVPTTSVRTVGDVIGGANRPAVAGPTAPATAGALANGSLETRDADGGIACWTHYTWGDNTATVTTTGTAHTGRTAARIGIDDHRSGAAGLYPTFDTGACSPSAEPGHQYTVTAWYTSSTVVQFVAYYRNRNGGFTYWTSGPYIPAASTWQQASWTTPELPADATGVSIGLSLFGDGTLTIDDIAYADAETPPPPATPSAMGNASLEDIAADAMPVCWSPSSYGDNNAEYALGGPGHTGDTAMTVTITDYASGAGQLLPTLFGSTCAPRATPGTAYTLSAWYQSDAVTQFAVYYLDAAGTWTYWTSSPWLHAKSEWTNATWTTPTLPGGATRIAYGLSLFGVGQLTTDDYSHTPVE